MKTAIELLSEWVFETPGGIPRQDGMSGMDGHYDICSGCRQEAYEFADIKHDEDCLWIASRDLVVLEHP